MIKDQEYLKSKASYCLDLAKKLGATDASVTIGNSISETVNFRNKTLDESNRSDSLAMGIETYIGKKKSSISSSNLLDENLKILIEKCYETTKITPEDEFNSLPDKELLAKNIKDLNLYDDSHLENDKKIDYLFIDGDHSYHGVKKDYHQYKSLCSTDAIIGIHDINIDNRSPRQIFVSDFWDEIKNQYKTKELFSIENVNAMGIGVIYYGKNHTG